MNPLLQYVRPELHRAAKRQLARVNPCPACGAASGQKCKGTRGQKRSSNHAERLTTPKSPE